MTDIEKAIETVQNYQIKEFLGRPMNDALDLLIKTAKRKSVLRAQMEREKGCGCPCGETDQTFCETCNKIRVQAIKEKLERDNPQPLTLTELKERVGKIVWRKGDDGEAYPVRINGFTDWCMSYATIGSEVSGLIGLNAISANFYDHEPKEDK